MVVLSASICTKNGKVIFARQFVQVNRSRIEGLLAAFPKLVGAGQQQHTFVESENVRYLYQPLEDLFLVMITTKTSNILEDLETLKILKALIPEYCRTLHEEEVTKHMFDLLFAFDEVVSLGYREAVSLSAIRTYTEMESHAEEVARREQKRLEEEAKAQQKLRIKQMDLQKKEALRAGRKPGGYTGGYGGGMGSGMGGGPGMGGGMGGGSGYAPPPTPYDSYTETRTPPPSQPSAPSGGGMQLGKKTRANDIVNQMKSEEGYEILQSAAAAPAVTGGFEPEYVPKEPVEILIEEKVICVVNRDGGVENMEVKGDMSLRILDPSKSMINVKLNIQDEKLYQFKTHPNVDKKLFTSESLIALKDAGRAFPVNQPVGVLKWRFQSKDESDIPISINCWPTPAGDGTMEINIEYELEKENMEFREVVIAIPVPRAPVVHNVDGEYSYNRSRHALEWKISLIDEENKTGSMFFSVEGPSNAANFFPVVANFFSQTNYCSVDVAGIKTLDTHEPVSHQIIVKVTPEEYTVV